MRWSALLLIFCLAGCGAAPDAAPISATPYSRTLSAALTTADQYFSQADANGDGFVSQDEYLAFTANTQGRSADLAQADFAALDLDHDSKLSRTEFERSLL